jgi:transcriptional regulator with XRE-family HTH domain
MDTVPPNIGPRIKALREQRKLSLRALAERCSLSVNAISLIERGENSPTVSSLHLLATALEVKITDFFDSPPDQTIVLVKKDHRIKTQGNGWIMESLGVGLSYQQIEPFMVTLSSDVANVNAPITHPGQEFAYCVEGEIRYQIGDECYPLVPGDSLIFLATQPHYFQNAGSTPSKVLLVFYSHEGNGLAYHRHLET